MRIYTQHNELVEVILVYVDMRLGCIVGDTANTRDYNSLNLGNYEGFYTHSNLDVLKEVMMSMAEFFNLFPNDVFFMPTQEEIEDRIKSQEDDEE